MHPTAFIAIVAACWLLDRVCPLPTGEVTVAFPPILIVAAALAAKKGIDAYGKAKAAKQGAKNAQAAQQYEVAANQKVLDRKALNFASLLKALGREGWYGDPAAEGSFMSTKGKYDPKAWEADAVPLARTPSVAGSTALGAASGVADAVTSYYGNTGGAANDAWSKVYQGGRSSAPPAYDPNAGRDPNRFYYPGEK